MSSRLGAALRRAGAAPFALLWRLSREGRVVTTVVCGASVFAVDVGRGEAHVVLAIVGSLIIVSLLASIGRRMEGVDVVASAPRGVAVGEELQVLVMISNRGPTARRDVRVEPPRASYDGSWLSDTLTLGVLPPSGVEAVTIRGRFRLRGEHLLGAVRASELMPFGLAQGAAQASGPLRFVVVPKPARVSSLTLRPRSAKPDARATRNTARDRSDIAGVRPYRAGDPVRDLHARSWARVGFPVVREYRSDEQTSVALVVDTDAGRRKPEALEAALSLAAGVSARLAGGEVAIARVVVGDRELAPTRGGVAAEEVLDALAAVKRGGSFSAAAVLARLARDLPSLSSVVFVSIGWDAERARLAEALRKAGVFVLTVAVGEASGDGVVAVTEQAVLSGKELAL